MKKRFVAKGFSVLIVLAFFTLGVYYFSFYENVSYSPRGSSVGQAGNIGQEVETASIDPSGGDLPSCSQVQAPDSSGSLDNANPNEIKLAPASNDNSVAGFRGQLPSVPTPPAPDSNGYCHSITPLHSGYTFKYENVCGDSCALSDILVGGYYQHNTCDSSRYTSYTQSELHYTLVADYFLRQGLLGIMEGCRAVPIASTRIENSKRNTCGDRCPCAQYDSDGSSFICGDCLHTSPKGDIIYESNRRHIDYTYDYIHYIGNGIWHDYEVVGLASLESVDIITSHQSVEGPFCVGDNEFNPDNVLPNIVDYSVVGNYVIYTYASTTEHVDIPNN